MTQTLLDPRMFDTSQALGAHDASSLTNVPAGMSLVSHQSITSSTANLIWTDLTAEYHYLAIWNLKPVTDAVDFDVEMSVDNGSTYLTSGNYRWGISTLLNASGTENLSNSASSNALKFNGANTYSNTASGSVLNIWFDRALLNNTESHWSWTGTVRDASNPMTQVSGGGGGLSFGASHDVDAIRFAFSSGNIATAEASLFSVATS